MNYVDGFVLPVLKKKIAAYRSMAKLSAKVWLQHGALAFYESVADDVPYGKRTSFPRSVKLKRGETVVFSWIVYKSRAHRDRVMAKVMKDKRIAKMMQGDVPFDAKRMIFGGFKVIVEAWRRAVLRQRLQRVAWTMGDFQVGLAGPLNGGRNGLCRPTKLAEPLNSKVEPVFSW